MPFVRGRPHRRRRAPSANRTGCVGTACDPFQQSRDHSPMKVFSLSIAATLLFGGAARAQHSAAPVPRRDSAVTLVRVNVTAEREDNSAVKPIQLLTLPVTA